MLSIAFMALEFITEFPNKQLMKIKKITLKFNSKEQTNSSCQQNKSICCADIEEAVQLNQNYLKWAEVLGKQQKLKQKKKLN